MLNKVKLMAIVGFILTVIRTFLPHIEIPEGLDVAIVTVILFLVSFFTPESPESLRAYKSQR